eukprot:tig00000411_g554.t2
MINLIKTVLCSANGPPSKPPVPTKDDFVISTEKISPRPFTLTIGLIPPAVLGVQAGSAEESSLICSLWQNMAITPGSTPKWLQVTGSASTYSMLSKGLRPVQMTTDADGIKLVAPRVMKFATRCENKFGKSESDEIEYTFLDINPPAVPNSITVIEARIRTATISFKPWGRQIAFCEGKVNGKVVFTVDKTKLKLVTAPSTYGAVTVVATDLTPGTSTKIMISCTNENGQTGPEGTRMRKVDAGTVPEEFPFMTQKADVMKAPTGLTLDNAQAQYVGISFALPDGGSWTSDTGKAVSVPYKTCVITAKSATDASPRPAGSLEIPAGSAIGTKFPLLTLVSQYELKPNTDYTLEVFCKSDEGDGPKATLAVKTLDSKVLLNTANPLLQNLKQSADGTLVSSTPVSSGPVCTPTRAEPYKCVGGATVETYEVSSAYFLIMKH